MGSDDLFKKRRAQSARDIERKRRHRRIGERVLIVCEGEKTEPFYFRELCQDFRLATLSVRVAGSDGSSPSRVVDYADMLFKEDAESGQDRFDHVYCVFDRDDHSTFDQALRRVDQLKSRGEPFVAIVSYPCFEYWFLSHFVYTRRLFHTSARRSVCGAVIAELRRQPGFEDYDKGRKDVYGFLKQRMEAAICHSERAAVEAERDGEFNPSTSVHLLVQKLLDLARPKDAP